MAQKPEDSQAASEPCEQSTVAASGQPSDAATGQGGVQHGNAHTLPNDQDADRELDSENISDPPSCTPEDRDACTQPHTSDAADTESEQMTELDRALLEVAELKEQLARRNADVYNLQQEYSGYVKRSKQEAVHQFELGTIKVLEGLIPVLDNAQLTREHGELDGPAGKVIQELEHTLTTNYKLERFGAVGDAFDPALHEALMHCTSDQVQCEQIQVLMQPGYRVGEKVLRPARVGVVSPE